MQLHLVGRLSTSPAASAGAGETFDGPPREASEEYQSVPASSRSHSPSVSSRPRGESVASDATRSGAEELQRCTSTPRLPTAPPSTPTSSAPRQSLSSASGAGAAAVAAATAAAAGTLPQTPRTPDSTPRTPVWTTEPISIHEPLLLLDEEQMRAEAADRQQHLMATVDHLREELSEVRAGRKANDAALEAATETSEALECECARVRAEQTRLEQANGVLRLQLQDHHGIMAADWAQTIVFQEQLKHEEAEKTRLADEVAQLQRSLESRTRENLQLKKDASRWQLLRNSGDSSALSQVKSCKLDSVLEVAVAAVGRLSAEACSRRRAATQQLHNELEQQLCVVCRDEKKAVLFQPCLHICVCEGCRGRLRPYRCPMCQEPVQSHIVRVHF